MRKVILVLLGLLPIFSFAGVILTIGGMRKFKKEDKTAETAQSYVLELQAQKNQIGLALKF